MEDDAPTYINGDVFSCNFRTVASLYVAKIDWLLFIAMMVACLALQIATNLFNEYYDFKRGLDTAESVGIGGGIVRHGLKPKNVLTVALLLYVVAAFYWHLYLYE